MIKINIMSSRKFKYTRIKQMERFAMKNRIKNTVLCCSLVLLFCITINIETQISIESNNNIQNEHINGVYDDLFSSLSSNASATYQVSSNLEQAIKPRIATDRNKNVHVVWVDMLDGTNDILYRKFTYATQTWGTITNLSDYSSYGEGSQDDPTIAIDEYNNIWVAWIDKYSSPTMIVGRYYNSSTSNWVTQTVIRSGQESWDNYPPQLANSTGGNFTIVYARAYSGSSKIYFRHYDRLNGWGEEFSVISGSVEDRNPSLYYDAENRGHLVFRRRENSINSIIYCNLTRDPEDGIMKFGIDATGEELKILNVTQNLKHTVYTYAADNPDLISIPSKNQIYVTWEDRWNSSGSSKYQIRLVNLTRTSYVENSILHKSITNLTVDLAANKRLPKIGLGFNSTNPSLIWNSDGAQGKVILKKTLTSTEMEFDHDTNNILTATIITSLCFDKHYTLSVVYSASRSIGLPYQIWFRQYDVWGPQLTINSPVNNTLTTGNVTLDVSTEIDTRSVTYEYYIDKDGNGLADDSGSSWVLIKQISSTTNQFDAEWNTTEDGSVDHLNILIRTTAVDINGLDEVKIQGYIIVDNHIPQTVRLTSFWDNSGHFRSSSTAGTYYFCNTTSINYIVSDNCSGIDYVTLFNGATPLGTNNTSGNNTAIIFDTSNGLLDGTYNNLFIRAYDRTGNENSSTIAIPTIIIDNIKPIGTFLNLIQNNEYSRNLGLNLTTVESDTASVQYYYRKSTDPPGVYTSIGSAAFSSGAWRRIWNTVGVPDGQYTIRAEITDLTGWVNLTEIDISIDNTAPTPVITNPVGGQEVGARVLVSVRTDLDTVQVNYYNCSTQFGVYKIFNSTIYYTEDSQYRYFSVYFDAITLNPGGHYLKVMAIDNQNYRTNTTDRNIQITNNYPNEIDDIIEFSYIYVETDDAYNVTISWQSPDETWNIVSYAIFRIKDDPLFFSPQSIQTINAMSPIQKFNLLGNVEGDKYFVKQYDVEEIDDEVPRVYEWSDSGLSASSYYYIIIAINIYQNPSNCSPTVAIHITPENPERSVNFLEVEFLPYLAIIYTALLASLTVISVKSTKSKQRHKETRVKLESMYEEKFSKEGEKTFEQRMDEMETVAETKVVEKAAPAVKESIVEPVKKTKEDNFLEMKLTTEDVKTTESEGPRRCPNCNWIISSKAFKCPRCGKAV